MVDVTSDGSESPFPITEPDTRGQRCGHNNGSFCNELNASEREKLKAISQVRQFRKGVRIGDGDEPPLIGNVVSGVLKLTKSLPDGRQQIVGLLLPTDMFGYGFGKPNGFSIEAATNVTLCTFHRHRFEALMGESPSLERTVASAITSEFDNAREWVVLMSGSSIATRVAGFLLMLCRRWPRMACKFTADHSCIRITVPIDRNDLAQYLGTTVESLSRTVQEFAKAGILRVLSASHFEVLDPRALVEKAGMPEFTPLILDEVLRGKG